MDKQRTSERDGGAPTIGYLRRNGVEWVEIHCVEIDCDRRVAASFAAIELPDTTALSDIAVRRSWLCSRCGSRRVIVAPDWTERADADLVAYRRTVTGTRGTGL